MSKFKVGDKVRFLNSEGFGVITRLINSHQLELENEHGFNEVYFIKHLVLERDKEDYQTDNLSFDKQVNSKIHADKFFDQSAILKRKFRHLEEYGNKERDVVDLHIENLIDSHNGMSNFEILTIQMTHFRRFLNASISKQHRKIVVVHGVGEGVLRNEIRKDLDIYHSHLEYHDAPYKEFGFGATEIRLRK
jgi:hypothetical protein